MSFVYAEFFDNSLFALPALNWTSCREQNNKDVIAHCSVLALYALNGNWIQLQLEELVDVRSQNQKYFLTIFNCIQFDTQIINLYSIYWMNLSKVIFIDHLKMSKSTFWQLAILSEHHCSWIHFYIRVGLGNINCYWPNKMNFRANLMCNYCV